MIIRKKGSIINISSTAGIDPSMGRLAHSSSKAAMIIASKALSKELSKIILGKCYSSGLTRYRDDA